MESRSLARGLWDLSIEFVSTEDEALQAAGRLFEAPPPRHPTATLHFHLLRGAKPPAEVWHRRERLFGAGLVAAYRDNEGLVYLRNGDSSSATLHLGGLWAELRHAPQTAYTPYALLNTLLKPAAALLLRALRVYCLHAASVLRGAEAFLLVGAGGTGKSTIAVSAARTGMGTVSDDLHFTRRAGDGQLEALGFPGEFSIAPFAGPGFPELQYLREHDAPPGPPTLKRMFEPQTVYPGSRRARCIPTHLVFLDPPEVQATRVTPISPSQALCRLIANSELVMSDLGNPHDHLQLLTDLVGRCACAQATLGPDVYFAPHDVLDRIAASATPPTRLE